MEKTDNLTRSSFFKKVWRYFTMMLLIAVGSIFLIIVTCLIWLSIEDYRDDKRLLSASALMIPGGIEVSDPIYIEKPNDWDGSFSILLKLDKDAVKQINAAGLSFLNAKRIGLTNKGNEISYNLWRGTPVIIPQGCFRLKGCERKIGDVCEKVSKALNTAGNYYTFSDKCLGIVLSPADETVLLWFTHA